MVAIFCIPMPLCPLHSAHSSPAVAKSWASKAIFDGDGLGHEPNTTWRQFVLHDSYLFAHLPPPCDYQIRSLPFLIHLPCVVDVKEEIFPKIYSPLAPFCVPLPALSLTLASCASTSSCCNNKEQDFQLVPRAPIISNQRHTEELPFRSMNGSIGCLEIRLFCRFRIWPNTSDN